MSGTSVEHNRRAVYSALSRTFDDRMLIQQCYGLWEQYFSKSTIFRVTKFIDGLVKTVGLVNEQRRNLSIALYADLARSELDLPEVPKMLRAGTQHPAAEHATRAPINGKTTLQEASAPSPKSPSAVVFAHLVNAMVERVGKMDASHIPELVQALRDNAAGIQDNSGVHAKLLRWADEHFDPAFSPAVVAESSMTDFVHAVYLSVCEVVGPVQADKILSAARTSAEALPEAANYSPGQLL